MILCEDNYPEILDKILATLNDGDIELVFVKSNEMRMINLQTRNIDKTTDVLSFPLENIAKSKLLGSVVINLDLVSQKATELGHSNNDEIALLFTHGLLHVLGYDHEIDNGQMRDKECEIITKFALPKSLIVRNS